MKKSIAGPGCHDLITSHAAALATEAHAPCLRKVADQPKTATKRHGPVEDFIFLSLAALFESFRDPCIILVSVPMSIAGALIFVSLGVGGASLNIYTDVGLVTLMGLISKHAFLIVEFANNLQRSGVAKREAIEQAAGIRLRPILMTTAAMVLGVVPLILASGAGAVSRFNMGLVIASGLSIGTLFTLFVVPAVYLLIATDHSRRVEQGASQAPAVDDAMRRI
jgi:multidrug efflux pump